MTTQPAIEMAPRSDPSHLGVRSRRARSIEDHVREELGRALGMRAYGWRGLRVLDQGARIRLAVPDGFGGERSVEPDAATLSTSDAAEYVVAWARELGLDARGSYAPQAGMLATVSLRNDQTPYVVARVTPAQVVLARLGPATGETPAPTHRYIARGHTGVGTPDVVVDAVVERGLASGDDIYERSMRAFKRKADGSWALIGAHYCRVTFGEAYAYRPLED